MRLTSPKPIDFLFWMKFCSTNLNIQPSEFFKMPYFAIVSLAEQLNSKPEAMTRKEMLDRMRETIKKRGWQE